MENAFTRKIISGNYTTPYDFAISLFNKAITGSYPARQGTESIRKQIIDLMGPENRNSCFDLDNTVFYMQEYKGKEFWIGVSPDLISDGYPGVAPDKSPRILGYLNDYLPDDIFCYIIPECTTLSAQGTIDTVHTMIQYLRLFQNQFMGDRSISMIGNREMMYKHLIANYLYRCFNINLGIRQNFDAVFGDITIYGDKDLAFNAFIEDAKYCGTMTNSDIDPFKLYGSCLRYANHKMVAKQNEIDMAKKENKELRRDWGDLYNGLVLCYDNNFSGMWGAMVRDTSLETYWSVIRGNAYNTKDLAVYEPANDNLDNIITRKICIVLSVLSYLCYTGSTYQLGSDDVDDEIVWAMDEGRYAKVKEFLDLTNNLIHDKKVDFKDIFYAKLMMAFVLDWNDYLYASYIYDDVVFMDKHSSSDYRKLIVSFGEFIADKLEKEDITPLPSIELSAILDAGWVQSGLKYIKTISDSVKDDANYAKYTTQTDSKED